MLYIQQSLGPNEQLIHIGKFHWMYTLQAFAAILWGMLLSVAILAGSVIAYVKMGYFPQNVNIVDAVPHLHSGIRIVAFFAFILGVWTFANMMIVKATTEIAVTNNRLVYKRGLVARHVGEVSINRIEGVNVLQSILGRIFDYGRLAIRGTGVGEIVLPPIDNPILFRRAIEKARSS